MFKKSGFVTAISLVILVLLSGCSKSNSSKTLDSAKKTVVTKKVNEEYYQNLDSSDKEKIKFEFKNDLDVTNSKGTPAGLPGSYTVSMTVKNKTDKIIKFDKSKFITYLSNDHMYTSSYKGTLTLKPGESKYFDQIFKNVAAQMFVSQDAYFIYLNMDNKLGKLLDLTPQVTDDSSNTSSEDTPVSNSQNDEENANTEVSTPQETQEQNTANASDEQKAIDIVSSQFGVSASELTAELSDQGGYVVSTLSGDETWRMGMNGIVIEHTVDGESDSDY